MLIIFWGIHGIAHYCWIPKYSTLDSSFFGKEMLSAQSTRSENAAKFQKNLQTLDVDSYGQYRDSHGKGNPREIGCFPIQTHAAAII
jgi:hypothetical protein